MSKRLVFRHTTEALFERAFGRALTPAQRARFKHAGLFAAAVDAAVFGEAFRELRDLAYPGAAPAHAEQEMGARFLASYFETTMGAMVAMMLRLLPVERALERVPQSLMSGTNFITASVERLGPREVRLAMNDYSTSPAFLIGVVSELVRRAGGVPVVSVLAQDGRSLTLRIVWQ